MKKRIKAVIPLMLILLLCACSVSGGSVLHNNTLRAVVADDFPAESSPAQFIADSIGAQLEVLSADSAGALKMLTEGKADIAVGYYSDSSGTDIAAALTMPFQSRGIYAVCTGAFDITALTDLQGHLLGASSLLPARLTKSVTSAAQDSTLYCSDTKTAAAMLNKGEIEAYICFEDEAAELLAQSGLRCCALADVSAESYCVAVKRQNTALFAQVNGAIGDLLTKGV